MKSLSSRWNFFVLLAILILYLGGCCPPFCPKPPKPDYDEESRLSPLTVSSPLYECATAVSVQGFVPGAKIDIYADNATHIGGGVSDAPWGQSFSVNPPLVAGQLITATQTVDGVTSPPSKPVKVVSFFETHPEGLPKPKIRPIPLYNCGGAIGVGNLAQGGLLEVFADGNLVGDVNGCGAGQWLFVNPQFVKDQKVHATEKLCQKTSPKSDMETVLETPVSLPKPSVREVYEGGKYCTVDNITNGAMVEVYNGNQKIAGHYCSGGSQIFRLDPQPSAGDQLTSIQKLCNIISDPSDPTTVKPCVELPAPTVSPICAGDDFIIVSGTAPDARIRIYADGTPIGDGGGAKINLIHPAVGGEIITVTQSLGACTSPSSIPVKVNEGMVKQKELLIMKNGHEFFKPEAGETSVEALVYTRGTGCSPYFMVKGRDDATSVSVEITDSKGRLAKTILLTFSGGYWSGSWDWSSSLWNLIPDEIPVGEYKATLKLTSNAGSISESMPFYVIFSPSEVSAPAEFGLSDKGEIGIWFGSGWGSDRALTYTLHPDDSRVFGAAIKEVNGQVDSYISAKLLHDWVANHFIYDLNYHTNDVIDLLTNHSSAQCADEANILTALLRAVGIPAHPATADAAVEFGGYNWNFDTWTEARIKSSTMAEQWYILHPHEYPSMQPETRATFGSTRGVATKKADDDVIMAGAGWAPQEVSDNNSDVTFGYNTPCKEPNQNFNYIANWLEHLCLQGYWGIGHWTCSPPLNSAVRIQLNKEIYRVGDEVLMDIAVENVLDSTLRGNVEIALINDDPTSKKWPDSVLKSFTEKIDLNRGKTYKISRSYRLPVNLSAANSYGVIVKVLGMEKHFYAVVPFQVMPLFSWSLKMPEIVKTGERFFANLTLVNESNVELKNLRVSVKFPGSVKGSSDSKIPEVLPPGGAYTLNWELQALSPSVVSQFIFNITTENGGAMKIYKGIEIRSYKER